MNPVLKQPPTAAVKQPPTTTVKAKKQTSLTKGAFWFTDFSYTIVYT